MMTKKLLIIILIITLVFPFIATTISCAYEEIMAGNIDDESKTEVKVDEEAIEEEIEESIQDEETEEEEIIKEEPGQENTEQEENSIEENSIIEEEQIEIEEDVEENGIELLSMESDEIQDGTYYIRTALNPIMIFDIADVSMQNQAKVQIWEKPNPEDLTDNQKFQITSIGNGYYTIEAKHSGKVLDVPGAGTANGTLVQQYDSNGSDAQQWVIKRTADGYFNIISKCNGLYIDIPGANASNGVRINLYEGNGSQAQKFELVEVDKPEEIVGDVINEGTYYLSTALNPIMVFDVVDVSMQNQAKIQIWEKPNPEDLTDNQKFQITSIGNGCYTITAKHSGKVFDVPGASNVNGTLIQQYDSNGSEAQQWIIKRTEDGYFNIISKCNGLYLDIAGANACNGARVGLYEGNGTNAQKFELIELKELVGEKTIEDGVYEIKTKSNETIGLDIASSSKENGGNVQLWKESEVVSKNQRFEVTYQGDGFYEIVAQHSNKALEAANSGMKDGTNVQQYERNDSDRQKWIIKDNGDNTYSIVSKLNGLYMDVYGGNIANGANIQLYEGNGSSAQKFIFKKVEKATCEEVLESGVYRISTALNEKMSLDIVDGSTSNRANVQIWDGGIVQQKKFQVTYMEEGYYEIKSVNSGKVLDVSGGRDADGTNVHQYESNGTEYQKWVLQDVGNGYFYVLSIGADAYLDVAGGQGVNGANIQIYSGNQTNGQKFKFEEVKPLEEDIYEIAISKDQNMQVDVDLASSNVQIWEANHSTSNQKFSLEYLGNKYYKIVSSKTKQVLTVKGTNVRQNTYTGADNQQWQIEVGNDGYFLVKSKSTGLYLDLTGGSTSNGTNIQVYEKNNTNAQEFKFKKFVFISDFSSIDEAKYPGYKEKLRELQIQHPTWKLNIYNTGMDWNTAINNQNSTKSLVEYVWVNRNQAWKDEYDNNQYEPGWYKASRQAIEYMMDPRNSLDEDYIFQFQDLSSASGTREDIKKMVAGTFLDTNSIIDSLITVAQKEKISPFHIVSRIIQEQGRDGRRNYERI